jgi:CheY-like chemotaxis protein
MGGMLNVESRPGFGSTFWFEIALAPSVGEVARARRSQRRIRDYLGARRRILVVDDNPANCDVLTELLRNVGFEVQCASTGEEALQAVQSFHADLVLMDLRMPGMGGLSATRVLRDRAGEALLIVAVSASAYDLDRRECLEAGCNDFLPKPIREETLWDMLERLLGVNWVYHDETDAAGAGGSKTAKEQVAPPEDEADAIHELASAGDVIGIRNRATALAERDPRLAPFAKAVIELAETFKMKAIRQYVAPWRSGGSAR